MEAENIEKLTVENEDYRRVYRTHKYSQMVFYALKPGEYLPWEVHDKADQFVRVEQGKACIKIQQNARTSAVSRIVTKEDEYIIIDSGMKHYIKNAEPVETLKMYIIYCGTPEHEKGKLQMRQNSEVFFTEEPKTQYNEILGT
jgi:mannose-6-phosphate isomerase-like protein (cupin superfamily)